MNTEVNKEMLKELKRSNDLAENANKKKGSVGRFLLKSFAIGFLLFAGLLAYGAYLWTIPIQ